MFDSYEGEWKDNLKHGEGVYKNNSTGEEHVGSFQKGKPHGKGKCSRWNYSYEGMYEFGCKNGEGKEVCDWAKEDGVEGVGRYEYNGSFKDDKFEGEGKFQSRDSRYAYKGEFSNGQPLCLSLIHI